MRGAGVMDTWLEIHASTESAGAGRDPKRTWEASPEFTVWAFKRTLSAGEATVAAARESGEEVVFEVWPIDGLTTRHRIRAEGDWWDITAIRDMRDKLHIYAANGRNYGA